MGQCHYCGSTVGEQPFCTTCQRPPDAHPKAKEGEVFGSHEVLRVIGEGPVGTVFEAAYGPNSVPVRLKVIDSELISAKPSLIERASQLAIASTGLHDALPQLFEEALENSEHPMISVKWVPGQPLSDCLQQGPLALEESCQIVVGLLDALGALHTTGLTHRDIKPGNVLITPEGVSPNVHLLDVGPSLISSEARRGAHYRSPEQARGDDLIGPGSDIYSCGAVLYECLCGHRPFLSNDFDVLMSQIAIRRPPAINQLRPDLSDALVQVVSRSMEASPSDRYHSAADMSRALQTAMEISSAERRVPAFAVGASPQDEAPPPMLDPEDLEEMPTNVHPSALPPPTSESLPPSLPPPSSLSMNEDPSNTGPSGGFKAGVILFLILAVVIGGGMMYYTVWAERQVELSEETTAVEEEPEKAPPRKSRGRIRIKLNGLPTGAMWYVDGRRLSANPFMAPKGAMTHTVRVVAPGHEPFETKIAFSDNQEIEVEMEQHEAVEIPGNFKAYTHGPGANVRTRPGGSKAGSSEEPVEVFGDTNAPVGFRNRQESAPTKINR